MCFSFSGLWSKEGNIVSLLACDFWNEECGDVACVRVCVILERRLPALGWPLAISQKDRLSYGIGSPWALVGWEISLIQVCLNGSASKGSCRLVGESLPLQAPKQIIETNVSDK